MFDELKHQIEIIFEKKEELVSKLLCNPNLTDLRGQTPLHKAAMEGNAQVIHELNQAADLLVASPDIESLTPLEHALLKRSAPAVKELLTNPRINSAEKTAKNVPMFHFAIKQQEKDCAMEFIHHFRAKGVEKDKALAEKTIDAVDPKDSYSSVSCAGAQGLVDVVVELINLGAKVDLSFSRDVQALEKAMKQGHHKRIKEYLHGVYLQTYKEKRQVGGEHNTAAGGLFASIGIWAAPKEVKLAGVDFLKSKTIAELEEDITDKDHPAYPEYLKNYNALKGGEVGAIFELLRYTTHEKINRLGAKPLN